MTLSLLTTSRHHLQLEEFQAASQSVSDSGIATSGSEAGDTPTNSAGSTPATVPKQKRSKNDTPKSGDRNSSPDIEFAVPAPPKVKATGRKKH